jgi:tetratricopeptide (TPR) repeat protein
MVSCKHCATQNSLDSAFCKKCGTVIPTEQARAANDRLERAVADGFKAFNAGRVDEAMHVAEQAVAENPTSTTALSLKAMCHERRGEISEALDCHERILELDPESMIDKIKVNDLRNILVTSTSAAAVPDRRFAIMGAVAAFVLVASIGVLFAKGTGEPTVAQAQTGQVGAADPATRFDPGATNPQVQTPPGAANTVQTKQEPAVTQQQQQPDAQQTPQETATLPKYTAPSNGPQLPNPVGNSPFQGQIGPFRITPDQIPTTPKSQPAARTSDPEPQPETQPQQPQPKPEAPGIMEIKIVGKGGSANTNEPGAEANGPTALVRTARYKYQTGDYAGAALNFERALRAGADPGSINQRLGDCYAKLGRNGEAASAYNRAIDSLQAQISSGRGDRDRLAAALDSCRQAVKVLGG